MAANLLSIRLHPPVTRPGITPRQRLFEHLDAGLLPGCRLILVSAPAGYGKTTLVSTWLNTLSAPDAPLPLWLLLEEGDNDPVRFFTYLAAAFRAHQTDLGGALLSLLALPQLPPAEALFTELLNDLAEFPRPFLLVMDDLQALRNPALLDGLAFFIEHLPQHARLVIATREDPPLPLARMRMRGEMVEVRAADLRFNAQETGVFFQETLGSSLDAAALDVLAARTEGWAAGLQLAALALRASGGAPDARFLDEFGGSHRYVIDYLVDEVLRQLPAEVRDFLVQTSILERFNAGLCAAVIQAGENDASAPGNCQSILERLERANLFTIPLDGTRTWFRYHRLFADVLRAGLPAAQEASAHRRAAQWWIDQVERAAASPADTGMLEALSAALRHLLAAREYPAAAAQIARFSTAAIRHGELFTLLGWLDALPPDALAAEPDLPVVRGVAHVLTGQVPRALRDFSSAPDASQPLTPPQRGRRLVLQSWLSMVQGQFTFGPLIDEALTLLDDSDPFFYGLLLIAQGTLLQWQHDLEGSTRAFEAAYQSGLRENNLYMLLGGLTNLVFNLSAMGRRREAKALCLDALRRYVDSRGRPLPVMGMVYIPLAEFLYAENDLEGAQQYAAQGLELCQRLFSSLMMGGDAEVVLADITFARGDAARAFEILAATRRAALDRKVGVVAYRVQIHEAWLHVRLGSLAEARRLLEESRQISAAAGPSAQTAAALLWARLHAAGGEPEKALPLIEEVETAARASGRVTGLVNVLALRALVEGQLGRAAAARETLTAALALAAPADLRRVFLDSDPALIPLLRAARPAAPAFVDELLGSALAPAEARGAPHGASALPEPLSEQELTILGLLVEGKSNGEIAERLYITVGTAKWHVHNILAKLGVTSRGQAAARARELKLIE